MSIVDLYKQLFGRKGIADGNVIDLAEHGRAGGVSTGQPFKFVDFPHYIYKLQTSGSFIYIGKAIVGATQDQAVWQAFRFPTGDGQSQYADGNDNFDNIATDLTVLTYS